MAEYKAIRGHTIRTIDGDASPLVTGDIWYSSITKKIRGAKIGAGAWTSGGNINTARSQLYHAWGTQTAGQIATGNPPNTTDSEQYDGSTWTEVANINTARYGGSSADKGSTTAGLIFGGNPAGGSPWTADETESWNGSTWTEVGDLNESKRLGMGAGTSTAALAASGYSADSTVTVNAETFDGSSWTEVNNLNTARHSGGGGGPQTAALYAGGQPGTLALTELWDGTSWTESGDMNSARGDHDCMATSSSAAVAFGGDPSPLRPAAEEFDGSAWTAVATSSAGRYGSGGAGTASAGISVAGGASPYQATEEWTKAVAASSFTSS